MSGLLDAVDERFAVTGRDTPGWADPHHGVFPTTDDAEYSRLLDPGKYRIVAARLRAWSDVLVERGAMTCDPEAVGIDHPAHRAPGRVEVWRPNAVGALPIVLAFRPLGGVVDGVVDLGVGDVPVWVERQPDCGCDACDTGSAGLLEAVDGVILHVVQGAFVHLSTAAGTMWTTREGAAGSGDVDLDALLDLDPEDPGPGTTRGAAWITG